MKTTVFVGDRSYQAEALEVVSPVGIPLPTGNFSFVSHDQPANDGLQRIGYPEVWPLVKSQYCDLDEAWQWFWFRQLIHSRTGYLHWNEYNLTAVQMDALKTAWRGITKASEAFTNFKGTNDHEDFISGRNEGMGLPGQEPIICCGNIVKVLGGPYRMGGQSVMKIETLDGNRPPPSITKVNRLKTPHLVFCATNVAADKGGFRDSSKWKPIILPDGSYQVDPFHHLGGKDVPVVLRTNGKETETYERDGVWYAVNYITASRLKPVKGLVVPSPYVQ